MTKYLCDVTSWGTYEGEKVMEIPDDHPLHDIAGDKYVIHGSLHSIRIIKEITEDNNDNTKGTD